VQAGVVGGPDEDVDGERVGEEAEGHGGWCVNGGWCAKQKKSLWLRFFTTETKLLVSSQYASGLKPRQNDENNRGQKPLLHWWANLAKSMSLPKITKFVNYDNWSIQMKALIES